MLYLVISDAKCGICKPKLVIYKPKLVIYKPVVP